MKAPRSSIPRLPGGVHRGARAWWLAASAFATAFPTLAADKATLESVAEFPKSQVTGVTVSPKGRIFVNFPFWSDDHTISVAEVIDGKARPYPDEAWNAKDGPPAKRWVCVQSVVCGGSGALWVLDPASPKTEAAVKGSPKLVQIDLSSNQAVRTIAFDETIAPEKSYLNDVRFDGDHAYITESGLGALIVVELKTGRARRLLANHPATKVEERAEIVVDDMKIVDPKTGKAPAFHADGIALDRENGWLYFHALTAHRMYRIRTAALRDATHDEDWLARQVEKLADTPKPDGMLEARDGAVYLAAFEKNAIVRFDPDSGESKTVIRDERLQWPDTMAWGPDAALYVTTSQIHRMPKYHGGQHRQRGPFAVWRLRLP